MYIYLVLTLVLGLSNISRCELILQINKIYDNTITPVSTSFEEKVGSAFKLVCELVSTDNDTNSFDDSLHWVKAKGPYNESIYNNEAHFVISLKQINKISKGFRSLKSEEAGSYVCVSYKFRMYKTVKLIVRDNVVRKERIPKREAFRCNDHIQFTCVSSRLCIIKHYVCDGKPDCIDGSDESVDQCQGDPCKDKIPCNDGRCIPAAWCCDINHDLNCTVTNRPRCCQVLQETYEELEYGFPSVHQNHNNGARYLFISACIVSILFSIVLLLLIVSRVVIFAKKTSVQRHNICENIALRNQTNVNVIHCGLYPARSSRTPHHRPNIVRNIIIDASDVNDPLLLDPARFNVINSTTVNMCDQPPSYVDVLRNNRLISEPPPPYTSREMLHEDRQQSSN